MSIIVIILSPILNERLTRLETKQTATVYKHQ